MRTLPHTRSCFVCGESNPIGLKLRFETDGRIVQTRFVPRAGAHRFQRDYAWGLVSTLLDEMMAWACAVETKRFAYCAELTVRFLHPLRPGVEVLAIGEVVTNRRNKLFEAKAEVQSLDGKVLAIANGKYLPVKEADAKVMATDLIGDPNILLGVERAKKA